MPTQGTQGGTRWPAGQRKRPRTTSTQPLSLQVMIDATTTQPSPGAALPETTPPLPRTPARGVPTIYDFITNSLRVPSEWYALYREPLLYVRLALLW